MTVEEIKAAYSRRDIVERYGFRPTRAGFIPCPFHSGDRQASLKVYDRDFHCHACGAHGDIIDFVMMMDDVDFKTAYQSLGGEYQKPTFSSRLAVYEAQKQREMRHKMQERIAAQKDLNNTLLTVYRTYMERSEPLSDIWTDCYNALQYQLYLQAELNDMEARW